MRGRYVFLPVPSRIIKRFTILDQGQKQLKRKQTIINDSDEGRIKQVLQNHIFRGLDF